MTTYRVRAIAPYECQWRDVEAESPGEAAQAYHEDMAPGSQLVLVDDRVPSERTEVLFAVVEIEGHGELVSRMYRRGICRRGGVKRATFEQRLRDAAKALGWTRAPEELVADGWDLEGEAWA